jgi:NAD(P)-dependent dehydrogenase (short-subunit alcohol dehydrogenase family)
MDVSLNGKTILITGGTGALGSALVETCLNAGARVVFTYHQNETQAQQWIQKGASALKLDFTSRDQVLTFKEKIRAVTDRLDAVVFSAAIVRDKTISHLDEKDWQDSLETNLAAVFLMTKSLLGLLRKSDHGKIIHVISRSGAHGAFGQSAYAATKAALIGFTKSLAQEVGRMGISVNAVNPGFLASGMSANLPERSNENAKRESVLQTYSDAQEAAQFIVYLLSDLVTRVSGQVFHFESRANSS